MCIAQSHCGICGGGSLPADLTRIQPRRGKVRSAGRSGRVNVAENRRLCSRCELSERRRRVDGRDRRSPPRKRAAAQLACEHQMIFATRYFSVPALYRGSRLTCLLTLIHDAGTVKNATRSIAAGIIVPSSSQERWPRSSLPSSDSPRLAGRYCAARRFFVFVRFACSVA